MTDSGRGHSVFGGEDSVFKSASLVGVNLTNEEEVIYRFSTALT